LGERTQVPTVVHEPTTVKYALAGVGAEGGNGGGGGGGSGGGGDGDGGGGGGNGDGGSALQSPSSWLHSGTLHEESQ